jgi:serine/threonine protein kinase
VSCSSAGFYPRKRKYVNAPHLIVLAFRGLPEITVRHKDVKSENILLYEENGYTKFLFTDFGIAYDFDATKSMTKGPRIQGTLRYLAPEVAKLSERGSRSDVFSLGCVFLEVATVLAGRTLKSLYEHHGDDCIFHELPAKTKSWIQELEPELAQPCANLILQWCDWMMESSQEKRPYANDLVQRIAIDTKRSRSSFFCTMCIAELHIHHQITITKSQDQDGLALDLLPRNSQLHYFIRLVFPLIETLLIAELNLRSKRISARKGI